jgi:hypothetical protein
MTQADITNGTYSKQHSSSNKKMTCKGICIRHKALSRYASGNKRCQICDLFIKWDRLSCPCCKYKLRTGPRCFKFKAKLRKQKTVEEAENKKNIILSIQS